MLQGAGRNTFGHEQPGEWQFGSTRVQMSRRWKKRNPKDKDSQNEKPCIRHAHESIW